MARNASHRLKVFLDSGAWVEQVHIAAESLLDHCA